MALIGLLAAVALIAARKLGDFDLPWHLALGRALVRDQRLPIVDDFSFTARGQPAPEELLADVLLYLAWCAGGTLGLQASGALLVALLAWLIARRAGHHTPAPVAWALT